MNIKDGVVYWKAKDRYTNWKATGIFWMWDDVTICHMRGTRNILMGDTEMGTAI